MARHRNQHQPQQPATTSDGEDLQEVSAQIGANTPENHVETEYDTQGDFAGESDQAMRSDAEASGGAVDDAPDAAVIGYDKSSGKPIKVNRREQRLAEEKKRGPLARYKFKLMIGGHMGQDFEAPIRDDESGNPRKDRRRPTRNYDTGDTVWDNIDLCKTLNRPNSIKFRLLEDYGEGAYTDGVDPDKSKRNKRVGGRQGENIENTDMEVKREDLEQMSIGDLRMAAAQEDVDLSGCKHADTQKEKELIINRIMQHEKKRSRTDIIA